MKYELITENSYIMFQITSFSICNTTLFDLKVEVLETREVRNHKFLRTVIKKTKVVISNNNVNLKSNV